MRALSRLLIAVICLCLPLAAQAEGQEPSRGSVDPQSLVGVWRMDLRPTPDAEPYYQEFVVRSVEDGVLDAVFYGTDVTRGTVNVDWGEVHFAFVTEDGSGAYNTSGVLRDGRLEGRTHSLGRGFLSVWTATPAPPQASM